MGKVKPFHLEFPYGGVDKRFGYQKQSPYTAVDAKNVWPVEWDTGRQRGGTRPGVTTTGNGGWTTPYNWCEATWTGTGPVHNRGVAVAANDGTYVATTASNFTKRITTSPGSTFASPAVYQQTLYQGSGASGSTAIRSYDLVGGTQSDLTTDQTAGTAPQGCGIVQSWGDRLVCAGDVDDPQILYMSRVGNANDWDYSAVDAGAAWANSGGATGKISEPITSLIPHNRDCLLVGCTDSVYAVRGNPRAGGQVYTLSHKVGPLMQAAWCKTSNDFTFFMTRDGLYQMRPGCGEAPLSVSREKLPEDLTQIDIAGGDTCSIAYDSRFRGIHVYANVDSSQAYYFYDLVNEGFWPTTTIADVNLAFDFKAVASSTKSALCACLGTLVTQYDTAGSESIDSYLWLGPIALGSPHAEGVLSEITAVLSKDSGDIGWSVHVGDSPEEAFNATALFTGDDWSGDYRQYTQNPRASGVAAYIKLFDVSSSSWSFEEVIGVIHRMGRARVG